MNVSTKGDIPVFPHIPRVGLELSCRLSLVCDTGVKMVYRDNSISPDPGALPASKPWRDSNIPRTL